MKKETYGIDDNIATHYEHIHQGWPTRTLTGRSLSLSLSIAPDFALH